MIFAEDLEKIFGKRPWTSRNDELMAQKGESDELEASNTEKNELTEKTAVEKSVENAG